MIKVFIFHFNFRKEGRKERREREREVGRERRKEGTEEMEAGRNERERQLDRSCYELGQCLNTFPNPTFWGPRLCVRKPSLFFMAK